MTVFSASSAFAGDNATSNVAELAGSWSGTGPVSAEYLAVLTAPGTDQIAFTCLVTGGGVVRFWIDDHLFCDSHASAAGPPGEDVAPLPPFIALSRGQRYFLRLQFAHNVSSAAAASVGLYWATVAPGAVHPPPGPGRPVPTSVLSPPPVDHPQLARIQMQRDMATGCKDIRPAATATIAAAVAFFLLLFFFFSSSFLRHNTHHWSALVYVSTFQ